MEWTDERYGRYVAILEEELVAAMGCTEPIAIALAAARARELLGTEPARVKAQQQVILAHQRASCIF